MKVECIFLFLLIFHTIYNIIYFVEIIVLMNWSPLELNSYLKAHLGDGYEDANLRNKTRPELWKSA